MGMNSVHIPYRAANGVPFWKASFILPGWGQLCQYRPCSVIWFVICLALYIADWRLGVVAHWVCVGDAWLFAIRHR
jgi:hypothetical protein